MKKELTINYTTLKAEYEAKKKLLDKKLRMNLGMNIIIRNK